MREIKFRAWDIRKSEMVYDALQLSETRQLITVNAPYFNSQFSFFDGCKWMQFTGFKDKNGKDIYDGDILATSNNHPEYDLWDKDFWGTTQVFWNDDGFWDYTNWKMELDNNDSVFCKEFTEVIGNIHQNPELLRLPE